MGERILFVGIGLTHYYNQVLNRLQSDLGVSIDNVVADSGPGHAGEGVHQTEAGTAFRVVRLRELVVSAYYRSFRGLARTLLALRPAAVVAGVDYLAALALDPLLRGALRLSGARLIAKSIPFQVPPYQECLAAVGRGPRALVRRALLELRTATYRAADAHVTYLEEGVGLYAGYGVPAERVFVIGNSPDTDRMFLAAERIAGMPALLPPAAHRLVHVGRLVAWKRVDLLIRALARVRRSFGDAELLVIGDGPERGRLEELARSEGLAEAVRFLGGVYQPEELGRYLNESAVYVLAGMGGLSINDAMCFGKPIVCSLCDGTEKRLVRDGYNGCYFEGGDVESLAAAIGRILADPALRRTMGERSLRIVREEVNIHTVIDGYRRAFAFVRGQ